jgi:hypothetical protein
VNKKEGADVGGELTRKRRSSEEILPRMDEQSYEQNADTCNMGAFS